MTNKPWGYYDVLQSTENVKIKKLSINAGCRLSLQSHSFRQEDWYFLTGKGKMTLGNKEFLVQEGDFKHIAINQKHRIQNIGSSKLVILEVQSGENCIENDIVRYQDDYNRV